MHVVARFGLAAVTLLALIPICSAAPAKGPPGLPLADMIRETKVALLRVQEKAEAANLPPLANAVLELNALQQIDASGSVKFLVIELGGGPTFEILEHNQSKADTAAARIRH